MSTLVSSAIRRVFVEHSIGCRNPIGLDKAWRVAPVGLALLGFAAACSTESHPANSDGTSSSETSPSVTVTSSSADPLVPSAASSSSAPVTTPSAAATDLAPSESETTPSANPVGSSSTTTSPAGSGGTGSMQPLPPGVGGTTEPPLPGLDAGQTENPVSSDTESIQDASGPVSTDDVGADREGGTDDQGVAAPSCADDGPGRSDCGVNADESCCDSPLVEGGTYFRSYENTGEGPTSLADEATISSFRLDKYEVSVGRFRRFVEYLSSGGSPPEAGSGKHTHLNAGQGLADSGEPGGFEPGWDPSWNDLIPSGEGAAALWQSRLTSGLNGNSGCSLYGSWTEQPGDNEQRPITCTSWYESHAFCIWDGGFLPSEAEWKYAAAGGDEQRMYPWGTSEVGSDNEYAIVDCCYPDNDCNAAAGRDTCTGAVNAAPVGFANLGAGRYGQLDLIGNVFEWMLDRFGDYESPCEDCALLSASTSDRVLPGAGFHTGLGLGSTILYSWNRASIAWDADTFRGDYAVGLRCARSP